MLVAGPPSHNLLEGLFGGASTATAVTLGSIPDSSFEYTMKTTDTQARKASCHLWPHGHRDRGPLQLIIGAGSLGDWSRFPITVRMDQPHEDTNFTMIQVMFQPKGVVRPFPIKGLKFHNVTSYIRKQGTLDLRIKNRYTRSLSEIPFGTYKGSTIWTDTWAVMTFQAGGESKLPVPDESTIIQPGDVAYDLTLDASKRTLRSLYGVERGAATGGGLRDG